MRSRLFHLTLCAASVLLIASGFHKLMTPQTAAFQGGHGLLRIVFGTLVFVSAAVALVSGREAKPGADDQRPADVYDPYRLPAVSLSPSDPSAKVCRPSR